MRKKKKIIFDLMAVPRRRTRRLPLCLDMMVREFTKNHVVSYGAVATIGLVMVSAVIGKKWIAKTKLGRVYPNLSLITNDPIPTMMMLSAKQYMKMRISSNIIVMNDPFLMNCFTISPSYLVNDISKNDTNGHEWRSFCKMCEWKNHESIARMILEFPQSLVILTEPRIEVLGSSYHMYKNRYAGVLWPFLFANNVSMMCSEADGIGIAEKWAAVLDYVSSLKEREFDFSWLPNRVGVMIAKIAMAIHAMDIADGLVKEECDIHYDTFRLATNAFSAYTLSNVTKTLGPDERREAYVAVHSLEIT